MLETEISASTEPPADSVSGAHSCAASNLPPDDCRIIGSSQAIKQVLKLVHAVAGSSTTVLIEGETGTGKELVAEAIHRQSPRRHKPCIIFDACGVPESLAESELFGHCKGAFTGALRDKTGVFEEASGGPLILDEAQSLSLAMQARLLRALETREIRRIGTSRLIKLDVRIVVTTNADLNEEVKQRRFRLDLLKRIDVFRIKIPPLRQRVDDIAVLAAHLLEEFCRRENKPLRGLTPEALEVLQCCHWPGNVRELKNSIEHAVILAANGGLIGIEHLPETVTKDGAISSTGKKCHTWRQRVMVLERELTLQELELHHGNITHTATALGLSRAGLAKMMRRLRIK